MLDLRQRARPKRVVLRGKYLRNTGFSDSMSRVVSENEMALQFQNNEFKEITFNNEQTDLPLGGGHSSLKLSPKLEVFEKHHKVMK